MHLGYTEDASLGPQVGRHDRACIRAGRLKGRLTLRSATNLHGLRWGNRVPRSGAGLRCPRGFVDGDALVVGALFRATGSTDTAGRWAFELGQLGGCALLVEALGLVARRFVGQGQHAVGQGLRLNQVESRGRAT